MIDGPHNDSLSFHRACCHGADHLLVRHATAAEHDLCLRRCQWSCAWQSNPLAHLIDGDSGEQGPNQKQPENSKNNGNVFTIALLSVCRCMRVTAKGHRALAEGCPAIRYLRLYGCKPVTDDSLAAFASLQHLQLLDLCGAEHVTDGGLQV